MAGLPPGGLLHALVAELRRVVERLRHAHAGKRPAAQGRGEHIPRAVQLNVQIRPEKLRPLAVKPGGIAHAAAAPHARDNRVFRVQPCKQRLRGAVHI